MATRRMSAPPWVRRSRRDRWWKLADLAAVALLLGPPAVLLGIGCGNLLLILYAQLFT